MLERERARIRAELAIPLSYDDEIIGVLNLETPDEAGFSEAQRAELIAFAAELASVARMPALDAAELGRLLAEALVRAQTPFGQFLQLDGDELVIVQTTGGEPVGTRVTVTGSVSGSAVSSRAAVYVPDVDAEPSYHRYLGEEMKSELAVPLISGDRTLGVLNVESPVPGFFTAGHARILETLAGQAAVAIERAQRFEVERMAAIGGLAGDIVHRLNNPIGALSGWLDMLQRKPFYPELTATYPYVAAVRSARPTGHRPVQSNHPGAAGRAAPPGTGPHRRAIRYSRSRGACRPGGQRRRRRRDSRDRGPHQRAPTAAARPGGTAAHQHAVEPARQRAQGDAGRRRAFGDGRARGRAGLDQHRGGGYGGRDRTLAPAFPFRGRRLNHHG